MYKIYSFLFFSILNINLLFALPSTQDPMQQKFLHEAIHDPDMAFVDRTSAFFPDDSYVGLKCTRSRDGGDDVKDDKYRSMAMMINTNIESNFGGAANEKNYFGGYVHEYTNVAYMSLSPSNKSGWLLASYIFLNNESKNIWEFDSDEINAEGPYDVTKFETKDDYYQVSFNKEYNDNKVKDDALVYHWITFTFNRENMIYGMLPYVPSAGSCEIMDSSKLWSDLDSMNDRVIKYKAHNQKVLEAERKKSEEKKKF